MDLPDLKCNKVVNEVLTFLTGLLYNTDITSQDSKTADIPANESEREEEYVCLHYIPFFSTSVSFFAD